jgi:hypothetical protein
MTQGFPDTGAAHVGAAHVARMSEAISGFPGIERARMSLYSCGLLALRGVQPADGERERRRKYPPSAFSNPERMYRNNALSHHVALT